MSNKPLQIFDVLRNIDNKNIEFYRSLSDEDKKGFVPFVTMQWMFCTDNPLQRVLLNEFVNDKVFTLYKHPELLYHLMCIASPGFTQRYKWTKPASTETKFPKSISIIQRVYGYSKRVAEQSLPLLTNDDILEFAVDLGIEVDEVKKLKLELKKRK